MKSFCAWNYIFKLPLLSSLIFFSSFSLSLNFTPILFIFFYFTCSSLPIFSFFVFFFYFLTSSFLYGFTYPQNTEEGNNLTEAPCPSHLPSPSPPLPSCPSHLPSLSPPLPPCPSQLPSPSPPLPPCHSHLPSLSPPLPPQLTLLPHVKLTTANFILIIYWYFIQIPLKIA